jgi:hypothetical protein
MSPIRETDDPLVKAKKRKSTKGWDGEVGHRSLRNPYILGEDGKQTICIDVMTRDLSHHWP